MTTLTVTTRGRVSLSKTVLQHLGVKPGEKINLALQPGGTVVLSAAERAGSIRALAGYLKIKNHR